MNNINLIKTLCFSGLIPFYFLSIITVFNFNFLFVDLFSLYSLVILTFLSGSTWYHLIIIEKKETTKGLIIFIVLLPIFLIFFEILLPIIFKIFILAVTYLIIFFIDKKFFTNLEYLKIRKILTILVAVSHIIILFGIYSNSF